MYNYDVIFNRDEIGDLNSSAILLFYKDQIPEDIKENYEQQGGKIGSCTSTQDLGELVDVPILLEDIDRFEALFEISKLKHPFVSQSD
jgi:hypothetical protein